MGLGLSGPGFRPGSLGVLTVTNLSIGCCNTQSKVMYRLPRYYRTVPDRDTSWQPWFEAKGYPDRYRALAYRLGETESLLLIWIDPRSHSVCDVDYLPPDPTQHDGNPRPTDYRITPTFHASKFIRSHFPWTFDSGCTIDIDFDAEVHPWP